MKQTQKKVGREKNKGWVSFILKLLTRRTFQWTETTTADNNMNVETTNKTFAEQDRIRRISTLKSQTDDGRTDGLDDGPFALLFWKTSFGLH